MIVAGSILAAAVLVSVAILAGRPRLVRSRVKSRVIVTLKSGATFAGVLAGADGQAWVLKGVTALGATVQDPSVPVDGEVLVLLAEVDYCQRP